MLESILASVGAALLVVVPTMLTKLQKGEKFDIVKAGRTLAIGVGLGVLAGFTGYEIKADNYQEYVAANAGAVMVIEQGLKIIFRLIKKPEPVS